VLEAGVQNLFHAVQFGAPEVAHVVEAAVDGGEADFQGLELCLKLGIQRLEAGVDSVELGVRPSHQNPDERGVKQERDADGIAELNALLTLPRLDSDMAEDARRMIANPNRARTPFVPSFSFVTRENQTISNVSLRGKVALLDFWGTWCPPCRASIPMLKNVQKKYAAKGLQMASISSDDDEEAWKTFVDSQRM